MVTVAVAGVSVATRSGSELPNPSSTVSLSSSMSSWVADRVKVLDVSPESKVTLSGTPE